MAMPDLLEKKKITCGAKCAAPYRLHLPASATECCRESGITGPRKRMPTVLRFTVGQFSCG